MYRERDYLSSDERMELLVVRGSGDGGPLEPSRATRLYGVYLTDAGGEDGLREDSVRGKPTDPLLIDCLMKSAKESPGGSAAAGGGQTPACGPALEDAGKLGCG